MINQEEQVEVRASALVQDDVAQPELIQSLPDDVKSPTSSELPPREEGLLLNR